jgi:hypothetical protein
MNWADVDLRPTDRKLRQFSGILAAIAIVLAIFDPLWGIVVIYGLVSLAVPKLAFPVYAILTVATFPIGWIVSRVMLAALFYIVLTPIAIFQRLVRRDALRLSKPETESYWEDVETRRDPASYLRQF